LDAVSFQPWKIVLAVLSEFVRKEQEKVIEYLQSENQILRENLGGNRVLLSHEQRRRLAIKGKALGRQQLKKVATVAQADTILRWHRELVELNSYTEPKQNIGRPPTDKEIVELVLRMARENVSWGYKRIEGALHNLGYAICSSTVANILKQHGIEPAPTRQRTTSWSTFIKAHWDVFNGLDLNAFTLWLSKLVRYVFGDTSHSGATSSPTGVASSEVTPHPTTRTIQIARVTETATQPPRGPPNVARPSIVPREIRHAA
jgi:putative transposase